MRLKVIRPFPGLISKRNALVNAAEFWTNDTRARQRRLQERVVGQAFPVRLLDALSGRHTMDVAVKFEPDVLADPIGCRQHRQRVEDVCATPE